MERARCGQFRSHKTPASCAPPILTGDVVVDPGSRPPPLAVRSLLRLQLAPLDGGSKHEHALGVRGQRDDGKQPMGPGHRGDGEAVEIVGHHPGDELPDGPRIAVVGSRQGAELPVVVAGVDDGGG